MAARIDGRQLPISAKNECGAAAILLDVCEAAQDAFSTSLRGDVSRLSNITSQFRWLARTKSRGSGEEGVFKERTAAKARP